MPLAKSRIRYPARRIRSRTCARPARERDLARPVANGIASVEDQVQKGILQGASVQDQLILDLLHVELETDVITQSRSGEKRQIADEAAEVDRSRPKLLLPGNRGYAVDQGSSAPCGRKRRGHEVSGAGRELHLGQPRLEAEDDRQQIGEIMGKARGQLGRQLALAGLKHSRAGLALLGNVGGENIDALDRAVTDAIRREGGSNSPPAILVGKLADARFPGKGPHQIGLDRCK